MESCRILFQWSCWHAYYSQGICRGLEWAADPPACCLLKRRQAKVKKIAVNEWALIGSEATVWDPEDQLRMEMKVTDPRWYYATEEFAEDFILYPGRIEVGQEQKMVYPVRKYYWEYVLISRKEGVGRDLQVRESDGRLEFSAGEKISLWNREAWRVVSLQPVELHENYDYRIQLIEKKRTGEKKIYKEMPFPEPGKFAESGKECIRQLIYY